MDLEIDYVLEMAPVNIVHVIASVDPSHGGPSMSGPSLAAAQAALGHRATLMFHVAPGERLDLSNARATIPALERVELIGIPQDCLAERITAPRAAAALQAQLHHADVVHLHGLWDPIVLRAGRLALRAGKPYVISPRGMLSPWALKRRRIEKALIRRWWLDEVLAGSAFVHALNSSEQTSIAALDERWKIRVFSNGVFPLTSQASYGHEQLTAHFPALQGRPYVLFLGRLHTMKGLDYMADGFAQFAAQCCDIDLVVAGPDGGARAALEAQIEALNIRSRVHLVGPVFGASKFALLNNALCYLQTSRNEGFSMSILEALNFGLPAVISEQCFFPEVQTQNVGRVVPLSGERIAAALREICLDRVHRDSMGQRARAFIERDYTWYAVARAMIAAYRAETGSRHVPE